MSDLISRADAIEAVNMLDIFPPTKDAVARELMALPSAEQVTSKLQNPCDSLLTDDKDDSKEQKSKLDLISRADVLKYPIRLDHYDEVNGSREFVYGVESVIEYVESLPSADAAQETVPTVVRITMSDGSQYYLEHERDATQADAEPKWNCTANFVAEQLDRLRKMTDEEKWEFFRKFFGMGDAVQGEWKHTITWQPYCSNCEYVFGEDEEFSPFWKYCPMCGARMKGGDSE